MKNQEVNDTLFELIKSLSNKERQKLKKFLDVYTEKAKNYPLLIFEVYISEKVFSELKFKLKSKCKNLNHFRKEKSILKYRILDFLRIDFLGSQENNYIDWRKKMDYATILRLKGEAFWTEAIGQLQPIIEETKHNYSYPYSLIFIEELSLMYSKLIIIDYKDFYYYRNLEINSTQNLALENEIMMFFETVLQYYLMYKFIHSEEDITYLKEIEKSKFLTFNIEKLENAFHKISLVTAKVCFYFMTSHNDFKITVTKLEELINNVDKTKTYYSNDFLAKYYFMLCQLFMFTKEFNKVLKYADLLKSCVYVNDKLIATSSLQLRYHQIIVECNIANKTLEIEELRKLYRLYSSLNNQSNPQVKLYALFSFIKAEYYFKNYEKAKALANESYQVSITNKFADITSDISRLIELAALVIEKLELKTLNQNCEEIANLSSFHYNYFKRKEKKFHLFEMKLCSFMNSFEKKLHKGLKTELFKLKQAFKQLELDDEFGNMNKINSHFFDFNSWIDDCLGLCEPSTP